MFRRAVNNFTAEVSADAVLNEDDNVSIGRRRMLVISCRLYIIALCVYGSPVLSITQRVVGKVSVVCMWTVG